MKKKHWPFYYLHVLKHRVLEGHMLCNVQFCVWLSLLQGNYQCPSSEILAGPPFDLFASYYDTSRLEAPWTGSYCFLHSLLGFAFSSAVQLHHQDHWYGQEISHKILVDRSMCFHIFFSFWVGNMLGMAAVHLCSLNFVPVLAVSLMWHSGIHLCFCPEPLVLTWDT